MASSAMEVVNENHPEALCDFEEMEVQFKKDKTRVKFNLENFRQIRLGNARDLENFANLLDIAIINLKEAGLHHE